MAKNVNVKQLEQELSTYLESGKKAPLFIASYPGMGKTTIIEKVINSYPLILGKDFTKCDGYDSEGYDDWKLIYYVLNNIPFCFSDIANIIQTSGKHQTIVEVSLPNADFELEVNPIWDQYENQEWLLYRPTFEEWLQWAELADDSGVQNVNPQIVEFIRWAGEEVLYDSILNGSYEKELEMFNDEQLWPDKNYRYEGLEATKANEEKIKELSIQLNKLRKDEIGYQLDPREDKSNHYTPLTWAEISKDFNNAIMGILNRNIIKEWKYRVCLKKSREQFGVNYIHPTVLSEAIRHIPEEQWPSIISQYCIGYFIHGEVINEEEKDEVINRILLSMIEVATSEMSLPSVLFKDYLQQPKDS